MFPDKYEGDEMTETQSLPLLGLPTNNSRLIIDWDLYAKSIGSNRYPLMCSPPQTIYCLHAMF